MYGQICSTGYEGFCGWKRRGILHFLLMRYLLVNCRQERASPGVDCIGNGVNTFGTLHNCDQKEDWYGPNAWRTTGDLWSMVSDKTIRPSESAGL